MKQNLRSGLVLLALITQSLILKAGDLRLTTDPLEKRFLSSPTKPNENRQTYLRTQAAWQNFKQQNGAWAVQFNELTGKPHRAYGEPIALNFNGNPEAAAIYFVQNYLNAFIPPTLELNLSADAARSKKYWHVNLTQRHQGFEILWSRVVVQMTPDYKVNLWGTDIYDNVNLNTTPGLSPAQALSAALQGIQQAGKTEVAPELKILPLPLVNGHSFRLVYEVNVSTSEFGDPARYYTLVDAHSGEILYRQNKILHINAPTDIQASGTGYPTHPYNAQAALSMPYVKVVEGGNTYNADSSGYLGLQNSSPTSATFYLEGPWAKIYTGTTSTAITSFTANLSPGLNTISYDNATTIRHVSAYHHTNVVHDFMKNYLTTFTALDFPIEVRVDRNDGTCNAFYDGGLNFFTTGGGCFALSMASDVVYHEYGHGITNVFWSFNGLNFSNGAMGEGYSDIWGISITGNPILGIGFSDTDPNAYVRTYDFDNGAPRKVYPQDIIGEVHADGEIIAGAWWSTAQLLGSLADMTAIFGESHYGLANGPDGAEGQVYTDILIDALFADDNDGNLANGTPNVADITQAFALHGITLLSNADLLHTPVTSSASNTSVTLQATLNNVQFAWALSGVKGAFRVNNQSNWTPIVFTNTGGNNYSASIPGQVDGSVIAYYVGLEDINGTLSNVQPAGANDLNPNIPYYILVGFSKIFTEDFDFNAGFWTEGLPGDLATTGMWEQGAPEQTFVNGSSMVQPNTQVTPGGFICYVTGAAAGSGAGSFDIDGGQTTLISPTFDLSTYINPTFEYYRWYTNDQGATPGTDYWQVAISNDGGISWVPVENTNVSDHSWRRFAFRVNDYVSSSSTVQVRFIAEDANSGSLVEGLMDEFSLWDALSSGLDAAEAFTFAGVYPNPAVNQIRLQAVLRDASDYKVEIINSSGQRVYSEIQNFASGTTERGFDLSSYSSGLYRLNLIGTNTIKSLPFTIVR